MKKYEVLERRFIERKIDFDLELILFESRNYTTGKLEYSIFVKDLGISNEFVKVAICYSVVLAVQIMNAYEDLRK